MRKVILHRFRPAAARHAAPLWLRVVRTLSPELAARLAMGRGLAAGRRIA